MPPFSAGGRLNDGACAARKGRSIPPRAVQLEALGASRCWPVAAVRWTRAPAPRLCRVARRAFADSDEEYLLSIPARGTLRSSSRLERPTYADLAPRRRRPSHRGTIDELPIAPPHPNPGHRHASGCIPSNSASQLPPRLSRAVTPFPGVSQRCPRAAASPPRRLRQRLRRCRRRRIAEYVRQRERLRRHRRPRRVYFERTPSGRR